jgi:hypothetical protein
MIRYLEDPERGWNWQIGFLQGVLSRLTRCYKQIYIRSACLKLIRKMSHGRLRSVVCQEMCFFHGFDLLDEKWIEFEKLIPFGQSIGIRVKSARHFVIMN